MIRLPDNKQRLLIVGRTGSGKSRAGIWHLSQKDFSHTPWVLINHKGEELINAIPGIQEIELTDNVEKINKKGPGLYVVNPRPELDNDAVTDFLWRIHAHGNCGVYTDEGYMIPDRDPAFQTLLTQGRSLRIPMITLSQRPVWITRFAISEADFYQVFPLNDERDLKTIRSFIPGVDMEYYLQAPANTAPVLPEYHSIYRDVGKNRVAIMRPVPDDGSILSGFKLKSNKRKLTFF